MSATVNDSGFVGRCDFCGRETTEFIASGLEMRVKGEPVGYPCICHDCIKKLKNICDTDRGTLIKFPKSGKFPTP